MRGRLLTYLKAAGQDNEACEEAEVCKIIDADQANASDEFPVVEEGDLPFHFEDGFFDGHKVCFIIRNKGYCKIGKSRERRCNRVCQGFFEKNKSLRLFVFKSLVFRYLYNNWALMVTKRQRAVTNT